MNKKIILNGVEFYRYMEKDSHGSRSENYWIDKKLVTSVEFTRELKAQLGPEMLSALHCVFY